MNIKSIHRDRDQLMWLRSLKSDKVYDAQMIMLMEKLGINEITAREILDSLDDVERRVTKKI